MLSLARSLGEFGAVKIVSGNIAGQSQTATLCRRGDLPELPAGDGLRARRPARVHRHGLPGHRGHPSPQGRSMSINVKGVSKKFGDFVALDDVTVDLPTGQLTALLGPSGGGKSTLLRIIAGLEDADSGTVTIEGNEATHLPPQKRNVGFVFQHYAAFKHMSVAKNVAFGLEIRKRSKADDREAGGRAARAGPPVPVRSPAPGPALRRPAPADGARPGPGRGADGAAARRAVRRPRRQGPQGAARVAAAAARRGARDDRVRDPRPGGGPRGRRRDRGHQRGPHRADRHARPAVRRAGERLRDELPRPGHQAQRPPGAPARHRRPHDSRGLRRASPARSCGCSAWASRCA